MGKPMAELTLSVEHYLALPDDLRRAVDDWLQAENLFGEDIWWFRLDEGFIDANCYLRPIQITEDRRGAKWERRRIPVQTLPPQAALTDGPISGGEDV